MTSNWGVREGLLIVNLGSPESTQPKDIAKFLRSFLSDKRVVSWPRLLWLPILHGIVTKIRPKKVKPLYESIWMPEGSPLTVHTKTQQRMLAAAFPNVEVRYAMAYSAPRIAEVLDEFEALGVNKIHLVPLYPQYAPSTVAAITDQVFHYYRKARRVPNLHIYTEYPVEANYIEWYARKLSEKIAESSGGFDRIVFSFHGVPQLKVQHPDYYRRQCLHTAEAIMAHELLADCKIEPLVSFQSKFGPGAWLEPATIDQMAQLPGEGVKSILVCTPGFVCDCIETLDEINVLNRETFVESGGKVFEYLNPMNTDQVIVDLVSNLTGLVAVSEPK